MGNFTPLYYRLVPSFLILFLPCRRFPDTFFLPYPSGLCPVGHSSSFWIKTRVIFPSPAPKPALLLCWETPLFIGGTASYGPQCCRGLQVCCSSTQLHSQRRGALWAGPCPPHSSLHTHRRMHISFQRDLCDRCFPGKEAVEFGL